MAASITTANSNYEFDYSQPNLINKSITLNQKSASNIATANATISGSGNNSYILSWDGADNGSVVHRVNSTGAAYLFPIGDLIVTFSAPLDHAAHQLLKRTAHHILAVGLKTRSRKANTGDRHARLPQQRVAGGPGGFVHSLQR